MKRINKKGFTLVELLAVIVVLAILVLLAIPAVTSMMNNAKKKSFVVEVENVIKAAKNAYSDTSLADAGDRKFAEGTNCFAISKLIEYKYLDKTNDSEGLQGSVCIDNENSKIYVGISNNTYFFKDDGTGAAVTATVIKDNNYSACPEYTLSGGTFACKE